MQIMPLSDVRYIVTRLPEDVRILLESEWSIMLSGGYIRSSIAGEKPNDIDLFGPSYEVLKANASLLGSSRVGSRLHVTQNALTLLTSNRIPVQFITRWEYTDPAELLASFDFTIAQALIRFVPTPMGQIGPMSHVGQQVTGNWEGFVGDRFYRDLAAKRLYYTSPVRDEAAGGSMLRIVKFLKAGYNIQIRSLAAVMARAIRNIDASCQDEATVRTVLTGVLREVDPLTVIDGLDMIEEHDIEGE